eukprot:14289995-Alexandrium_andersonii.AAC.1
MWQQRQQGRSSPIPLLNDYPASESSSSPPDFSEPDPIEDMNPTQNEASWEQSFGGVAQNALPALGPQPPRSEWPTRGRQGARKLQQHDSI